MKATTFPRITRYRDALAYALHSCEAAGVEPCGVQVGGFVNADVRIHAGSRTDLDRLAVALNLTVDHEDPDSGDHGYASTNLSRDHAPCTTLGVFGPQRDQYQP